MRPKDSPEWNMDVKGVFVPEKYLDKNAYAPAAFGIYKNLTDGNYCICVRADSAAQYPISYLLKTYGLHLTADGAGKTVTTDEGEKYQFEAETDDDSICALIRILNFASVLGKQAVVFSFDGHDMLCRQYAMTDIVLNGCEIRVPLLAFREDPFGMTDFNLRYPEYQKQWDYRHHEEFNIDFTLTPDMQCLAFIMKKACSYFVFRDGQGTVTGVSVYPGGWWRAYTSDELYQRLILY